MKTNMSVLATDMATGNLGWSVTTYDPVTDLFHVNKVGTVTAARLSNHKEYREDVQKYTKSNIVFWILEKELERVLDENKTDWIATEAEFSNSFATAYRSLVLCNFVFSRSAMLKAKKRVYRVGAREAKACVSDYGAANKETMMECIKNHPNIIFDNKEDKINLTEHQCDSVAIAYTFIRKHYPRIVDGTYDIKKKKKKKKSR